MSYQAKVWLSRSYFPGFVTAVTSCVTCYVISNHTSFCYIVDSANEMHLRVIAQPCARVPKTS